MFLWNIAVTSLAEVWIEIRYAIAVPIFTAVTSLAEVWIEMPTLRKVDTSNRVTSLAEVWIEIWEEIRNSFPSTSHFPCGSVD